MKGVVPEATEGGNWAASCSAAGGPVARGEDQTSEGVCGCVSPEGAGFVLHERGAQLRGICNGKSGGAGQELVQQHAGAGQLAALAAQHPERPVVQLVPLVPVAAITFMTEESLGRGQRALDGHGVGQAQRQEYLRWRAALRSATRGKKRRRGQRRTILSRWSSSRRPMSSYLFALLLHVERVEVVGAATYSVTSYSAGALPAILILSNQAQRRPATTASRRRQRRALEARTNAVGIVEEKMQTGATHYCAMLTYSLVRSLQLLDAVAPFDGSAFSIKTRDAGDLSKPQPTVQAAHAAVIEGRAEGAVAGTDAVGHVVAGMFIRQLNEVSDLNGHFVWAVKARE